MSERNERAEKRSGSLSGFIVAIESRRTDPMEPVSSQGNRRNTELPMGTRDEPESSLSVRQHQRQIAPRAVTRASEEPYALIGLVRVCGGAAGKLAALPGSM